MNDSTAEREIRDLLERWAKAAGTKDLDTIMACYAPDVRAFDAIAALEFKGKEAYRQHWEYCLGFVEGEMHFRIHDAETIVRDDIAVTHFLASCGATNKAGEEESGWLRGTVCLQETNGEWRIIHEHYSMPFDPESMKAMHEAKP